jgi:hypothetical protein
LVDFGFLDGFLGFLRHKLVYHGAYGIFLNVLGKKTNRLKINFFLKKP